jgi:hypothetical protein
VDFKLGPHGERVAKTGDGRIFDVVEFDTKDGIELRPWPDPPSRASRRKSKKSRG